MPFLPFFFLQKNLTILIIRLLSGFCRNKAVALSNVAGRFVRYPAGSGQSDGCKIL
jgi:hypothetical protein